MLEWLVCQAVTVKRDILYTGTRFGDDRYMHMYGTGTGTNSQFAIRQIV